MPRPLNPAVPLLCLLLPLYALAETQGAPLLQCYLEPTGPSRTFCELDRRVCQLTLSVDGSSQTVHRLPDAYRSERELLRTEKWTDTHIHFSSEASRSMGPDGSVIYLHRKLYSLSRVTGELSVLDAYFWPNGERMTLTQVEEMRERQPKTLTSSMPIDLIPGRCSAVTRMF